MRHVVAHARGAFTTLVFNRNCHCHRLRREHCTGEVQRPGVRYEYPDATFYLNVLEGKLIGDSGLSMLSRHCISLNQAVEAIKSVFLKIALPYSPQKSGNVR